MSQVHKAEDLSVMLREELNCVPACSDQLRRLMKCAEGCLETAHVLRQSWLRSCGMARAAGAKSPRALWCPRPEPAAQEEPVSPTTHATIEDTGV